MPPYADHLRLAALGVAFALLGSTMAGNMTICSLAWLNMSGSSAPPWASTAPLALTYVFAALAAAPCSRLQRSRGRRVGFVAAGLLGVAASLVSALGVKTGSAGLLAVGSLLLGGFDAGGDYIRFAAAEIGAAGAKPERIALVLACGSVCSVVGPELARYGGADADGYATYYLCAALLAGLFTAVVACVRVPGAGGGGTDGDGTDRGGTDSGRDDSDTDSDDSRSKAPPPNDEEVVVLTLLATARQRRAAQRTLASREVVAAAAIMVGAQWGMLLVMTATPIEMEPRVSFGEGAWRATPADARPRTPSHPCSVTRAIQFHLLGMFLPGLVSGPTLSRLGTVPVAAAGVGLMAACLALLLLPSPFYPQGADARESPTTLTLALLLLGVGWNLLTVAWTTILSTLPTSADAGAAQAMAETASMVVNLLASLGSGAILHLGGWRVLVWCASPPLVGVLVALALLAKGDAGRRRRGGIARRRSSARAGSLGESFAPEYESTSAAGQQAGGGLEEGLLA